MTFRSGILQQPPREAVARLRHDARVRQALVGQPPLQGSRARGGSLGDAPDVGIAVGEQRGDELAYRAG